MRRVESARARGWQSLLDETGGTMNRRQLLRNSIIAAGAAAAARVPGIGRLLLPEAYGQTALTPYPVLYIILSGGADSAMHFAGHPAGSVGNVTLVNRPTSGFMTDPTSNITYH